MAFHSPKVNILLCFLRDMSSRTGTLFFVLIAVGSSVMIWIDSKEADIHREEKLLSYIFIVVLEHPNSGGAPGDKGNNTNQAFSSKILSLVGCSFIVFFTIGDKFLPLFMYTRIWTCKHCETISQAPQVAFSEFGQLSLPLDITDYLVHAYHICEPMVLLH
jgi:hypothetical protein